MKRVRSQIVISVLMVLCLVLFLGRLLIGSSGYGWPLGESSSGVILNLRCLSAVTAIVVGGCLSVSGVYLQTLLRNPLASPYVLGLAGGAGVGVAGSRLLARVLFGPDIAWWVGDVGAACGALVVLGLVYVLSQQRGVIDPVGLLLIGVMIGMVCGAVMMLIEHLSPMSDTDHLIRWMMGSISQLTRWRSLVLVGVVCGVGVGVGMFLSHALDAASLSDDEAVSVGVPIHGVRLALFVLAGLMTAAAVTLTGPIGFVGLVCPHLGRLFVGARHAVLIPASLLIGAALLLSADIGTRLFEPVMAGYGLLPIGMVTSLIGGPLFIWMLIRARRRSGL